MPEPKLVEAVARAIAMAGGNNAFWFECTDQARAAIQAMREPPPHVLGAMHDHVRIECQPAERAAYILNADEMWAAGIDAAFASPEEGR